MDIFIKKRTTDFSVVLSKLLIFKNLRNLKIYCGITGSKCLTKILENNGVVIE